MRSMLLVDDTPELRRVIRKFFETKSGGRFIVVGEAGDGATGVKMAADLQPDVVLLDLSMPVMDGLTALPKILAACPTAHVVVFTGVKHQHMLGAITDAGASACVEKGRPLPDLLALVDALEPKT